MCPLVSSCFIYVPLRFLRMNHNKQESRNRKTELTQATSICSMRSLYVLLSCLIFQLAFWDNLEDQEDLLWTLQTPILAKWKLPNCPWKHRQMPWVKTEAKDPKYDMIRHRTPDFFCQLDNFYCLCFVVLGCSCTPCLTESAMPLWDHAFWLATHRLVSQVCRKVLNVLRCSEMFWDVLRCSEMFWGWSSRCDHPAKPQVARS